MRKSLYSLITILFSFALLLLPTNVAHAAGSASLYLSPACGPALNGANLTVDIHVNSGSTAINAVQSDLTYSSSQLDAVSVTVAPGWSQAQNDTTTPGTILFAAFPSNNPFTATGDQKVATVVFQAKVSAGKASVSFANSAAVAAASDNSNILTKTTGGTYPQVLAHTCGSLVKASNSPNIYLIADGEKRPITAENVFVSQGFNWGWIYEMDNADAALPTGPSVPFRDGTLVKDSSPTIYVIDNSSGVSQKRAITSMSVFTGLGYTSQDIISVSSGQLPAANGTSITNANSHPNGSLIKTSNSTIYLISNGHKRYIGSVYILYTHGYNFYQIKDAKSADLSLPSGNNLGPREGILVKGSTPTVYVIDTVSEVAQKRHISSIAVFNALGYTESQVVTVPDSNLPPLNGPTL